MKRGGLIHPLVDETRFGIEVIKCIEICLKILLQDEGVCMYYCSRGGWGVTIG